MPYNRKEDDSVRLTGLWIRVARKSGDRYWVSSVLDRETVEKMMHFVEEPFRIFIFKNSRKVTDKYPDAYLWLMRAEDKSRFRESEEKSIGHELKNQDEPPF